MVHSCRPRNRLLTTARATRTRKSGVCRLVVETLEDRTLLNVSFSPSVNYGVDRPNQVVTADFNGDGLSDMVVGSASVLGGDPGGLTVYMNGPLSPKDRTPPGQFRTTFSYSINDPANTPMVVGKFHRSSNDLDIVFLDASGDTVSMLRGNGNGTFVPEGTYTANLSSLPGSFVDPSCLVAGDFNGDGDLDLAVGALSGGNVIDEIDVLLGNGNGAFQDPIQATTFAVGFGAKQMVAADFDGDGKLDMACLVPGALRDELKVFRGNGDGTFDDSPLAFDSTGDVAGLAVGDFNRDGRPDLAVAFDGGQFFGQLGGVDVFLNRPTGFGFEQFTIGDHPSDALQAFPAALTVADFNGDGLPDIALACADEIGPEILENVGDGTFRTSFVGSHTLVSRQSAVAWGLFNTDNAPDLAITDMKFPLGIITTWANQPPVKLVVAPLDGFDAGAPGTFPAEVIATDYFGDVMTGYTGTVHFTSTDPQAVLPADYTFQSTDAGIHLFPCELFSVGTRFVDAGDISDSSITSVSSPFTVLRPIQVSGPNSVVAGTPFSLTVRVMDASGTRPDPFYRGTIGFASSDPSVFARLPARYTFTAADQGVHTFDGLSLLRAGALRQVITVTDPALQSPLGFHYFTGSTGISVQAAPATHLHLIAPAAVFAGSAFDATVQMMDDYGNLATDFLGTVTLASSTPGVTLPPPYVFTSADRGTHTFTLQGTGVITATATGASAPITEAATVMSRFLVVNTDDSGPGSLRQAILDANDNPGLDLIAFAIPGSGVHTISPTSPLPDITDPVTIDGYSQPGASANTLAVGDNAVLLVQLDGTSLGAGFSGLHITAGDSTVKGLMIDNFHYQAPAYIGYGILLETNGGDIIQGNWLGLHGTGGLPWQSNDGGNVVVAAGSSNNLIGGTTPAARNILSGSGEGVYVPSGTGNSIEGNYIGTDPTGTLAIGNFDGVVVVAGNSVGGSDPGAGNIVSGNIRSGISGSPSVVQGNFVGTDASGTAVLTNHSYGIVISNATSGLIGGTTPGARNVITGISGYAILIGASGINIEGNFIGTDFTGSLPVGDPQYGFVVYGANNTIGGTAAGAGNVIANTYIAGIYLANINDTATTGNVVEGNLIGTNASANAALGYNGVGVLIEQGASNNTIGGTASGAGNTIAFNSGAGVAIQGATTTGNPIRGNLIFGNAGKGIDLSASDVVVLPPTLLAAESDGSVTSVSGSFNAVGRGPYLVDYYASPLAGPGPAKRYLGSTTLNGSTNFFTATLPADAEGMMVTATATDAAGNTSEFSESVYVVPPAHLFVDPVGHITYTAGLGAANNLTLSQSGGSYTFHDAGEKIVAIAFGAVVCTGSGTNTVTCTPNPTLISAITVDVGDQQDTINVQAIAVPTTINDTGGGDDTVNVGAPIHPILDLGSTVQGITASLTVNDLSSHFTLNVNDSGDTGPALVLAGLEPDAVRDLAPGVITYQQSTLAALNVWLGIVPNRITVSGTPDNALHPLTTLTAGSGTAVMTIKGTAGPLRVAGGQNVPVNLGGEGFTPGTVQGINGDVTIDSPGAVIMVDDRQASAPRQVNFQANVLTGLAPGTITFAAGTAIARSLAIRAGSGSDTFVVNAALAQTTSIDGGGGNNTIQGPTAFLAGTWSITGADTGTLDGMIDFRSIQNLRGGTANDYFTFMTDGSISGLTDGGGGSNTLQGPNLTDAWLITGPNAGSMSTVGAAANVAAFASIQNLVGGSGADTFNVFTQGSLAGHIDGGANGSLSYLVYTGDIVVDLPLGVATAIAGGVTNIQNVRGSNGNDILVGNASAHTLQQLLVGGSGRNLIIAGAGPEILQGLAGDSILIGGTTLWDSNLTALTAIMHEFMQTYDTRDPVNDFNIRINNIRSGKGTLAGTGYYLDRQTGQHAATVISNQLSDTMDAAGLTCFWYDRYDIVEGTNPNDRQIHM
jgi:hypothetical protein